MAEQERDHHIQRITLRQGEEPLVVYLVLGHNSLSSYHWVDRPERSSSFTESEAHLFCLAILFNVHPGFEQMTPKYYPVRDR